MNHVTTPPINNVRVLSALGDHHEAFRINDAPSMRALWRAEERHFWHRSRNQWVIDRLKQLGVRPDANVLELGCGSGCVTTALVDCGYRVTGVDGHPSLVYAAARRAPGATFLIHDLANGFQGLDDLPQFDAVGLFDVLEHLDDPGPVLRGALTRTRPGGFVVGTVPALLSLWSDVDVQAGHRTRYSSSSLRDVLTSVSGARLVEVVPFNRVLVPMLWAQRRWVVKQTPSETSESNLRVPFAPVNLALYGLVRAEHRLAPILDRMPLPGSSLWFALQRVKMNSL